MQRNSVITPRPVLEAWRQIHVSSGVDQGAVYGCVDWYLYHEEALASETPASRRMTQTTPSTGAGWSGVPTGA